MVGPSRSSAGWDEVWGCPVHEETVMAVGGGSLTLRITPPPLCWCGREMKRTDSDAATAHEMTAIERGDATVYLSRYTPGLKPGDGAKIHWERGETVVIIDGRDEGRRMVLTSERRTHSAAPGEFIREGYLEDDPSQEMFAMAERRLWFAEQPYSVSPEATS